MGNIEQFKFFIALAVAKMTKKGLSFFAKSATSLPGLLAMKIDKAFLSKTAKYCKEKIITVTGTNGKTTTSSLIAKIVKASNQKVLHNDKGANMPQGVATAIALGISPLVKYDYFVLENDEAYLHKIYDNLEADFLLVTNLFLDQLDRYCELKNTSNLIRKAIDKNPKLCVVLNADDPMLAQLYTKNTVTFGFENIEVVGEEINKNITDVTYCECGCELNYSKRFYGQVGHYECSCGYKRKTPDILGNCKIYKEKTELSVSYLGNTYNFTICLPGIYNAYNALGSISIALLNDLSFDAIQSAFNNYKSVFGRADRFELNRKQFFIQLIKNPTGANEAIHTVCNSSNSNLFIAINDEYADGRDVSWLWDADFEAFSRYEGKIYVSGKRAFDMASRLKYADVNMGNVIIEQNIASAFKMAVEETKQGGLLNILPTYTALSVLEKILKKL